MATLQINSQVMVHQSILMSSGDYLNVLSVPFQRWMDDTDPASVNRDNIIGCENIEFMHNLRDEMSEIAEDLTQGSRVTHKGFTLHREISVSMVTEDK
jgi:hypothetical protein